MKTKIIYTLLICFPLHLIAEIAEETAPSEPSFPEFQDSLMQMLSTLGILMFVVLAIAWALKRFLNTKMTHLNETSEIKVLERRALNPKSALYLVEVEGEKFILGESTAGLHSIASLKGPDQSFQKIMETKSHG